MTLNEYNDFEKDKASNMTLMILSLFICQVSFIQLLIRLISGKVNYKRIPAVWIIIFLVMWLLWTGFFIFGISTDYADAKKNSSNPIEYMQNNDFSLTDILVFYFIFFFPLVLNCGLAVGYNRRYDRIKQESREFEALINDIHKKITDGGTDLEYLVRISGITKQAVINLVQYLIAKGRLEGYYFDSFKEVIVRERQKEEVAWICTNCGAGNKALIYSGEKPGCSYCGNVKTC